MRQLTALAGPDCDLNQGCSHSRYAESVCKILRLPRAGLLAVIDTEGSSGVVISAFDRSDEHAPSADSTPWMRKRTTVVYKAETAHRFR